MKSGYCEEHANKRVEFLLRDGRAAAKRKLGKAKLSCCGVCGKPSTHKVVFKK